MTRETFTSDLQADQNSEEADSRKLPPKLDIR